LLAAAVTSAPVFPTAAAPAMTGDEVDTPQRQPSNNGETPASRTAYTAISLVCMSIVAGMVGADAASLLLTRTHTIRLSSTTSRLEKTQEPMFHAHPHLPPLRPFHVLRLLRCDR
jgi:hypothetical protein